MGRRGQSLDVFCSERVGYLLACMLGAGYKRREGLTKDSQEFQPSNSENVFFLLRERRLSKKQGMGERKWEFGFGDFEVLCGHLIGDAEPAVRSMSLKCLQSEEASLAEQQNKRVF